MPFESLGLKHCPEDIEGLRGLKQRVREKRVQEAGSRNLEIVEIGTFAGATALALHAPGDTVYCVDHWRGGGQDLVSEMYAQDPELVGEYVFKTFAQNCKDKLFRGIVPCYGTSTMWASVWPFKVDMVWIDANHEFEAVSADIRAWMPHVKKGGLLCGHDYNSYSWETQEDGSPKPGTKVWRTQVKEAVDLLLPDRELCGRTIWYKFM
jgi:hypothetical protein